MKRNATRRLLTALLAAAMCLSMAACGSKPAADNGSSDTDASAGDNAARKYTIGVCQLVTHDALDAATQGFIDAVQEKLGAVQIDGIPDSSYVAKFLADRPFSLFKQIGTTEKPDVLCAKLLEGRVAVLTDGSPIALTLPYMLAEDFQSAQDYFVSPWRATLSRALRLCAVLFSLLLPAFYIAAQLFKLQILPFALLMTISGGIRDIPLSPSLELFFLLVVLEILI